ncbi:MAG: winged helix-turn-helix domain-containing protein [Gemmatimonadota bacterium]
MKGHEGPVYRFGAFLLVPTERLLLLDGEPVALAGKAFDLLVVLVSQAGHLVTKDELLRRVWPGLVVEEVNLSVNMSAIRKALARVPDAADWIETVPRQGYRFKSRVEIDDVATLSSAELLRGVQPSEPPESSSDGTAVAETLSKQSRSPRRRAALLGALALVALLATAAWLALRGGPMSWLSPADLARARLPSEIPSLSIIVLPLTQEGEAKEAEWLADALHGDLIVAIAKLKGSQVIARDTAATYKGRDVDPRQVAREMGVRHVVRGTLRREGTKVHLNVELIDGETGTQRWADSFETERAQLPQTVGDFAVAIERTLVGELYRTTVERRAALSPAEVNADDLAMQGYALWYRGVSRENVLAAREFFERALVLDPDSPRAWAGIQFTTANQLFNGWTDDRAATVRRAEEAVANLERVDRDGSPTYSAKTFMLFQQGDFHAMLQVTEEWVKRYRLPLAFGAYGGALTSNGRFDEAVSALERALRLGPRDPFRAEWQYRLARAHFGAGRYELARDWSQSAANTNARLEWPPIHAAALLQLGQREAAQRAFDEHMRRHPKFTMAQALSKVPGDEPACAQMRTRLAASLRELGLRD